ncbi:MAG TPA: hypothetical protein VKG79_17505 [Bryobacteraceae bacterium]|nr:hypothetical protein [Bryobacteraceae bacterium]
MSPLLGTPSSSGLPGGFASHEQSFDLTLKLVKIPARVHVASEGNEQIDIGISATFTAR